MAQLEKSYTENVQKSLYEVEQSEEGMRLDQFAQQYFQTFSREQIKKKILSGEIFIHKRPGKIKSSTKLFCKEIVEVVIIKSSHEDEYWQGEKLLIEVAPKIIFEDNDLLVIEKPPFMSTHPAGKHIFYCATVYFEKFHKKTIHSIHRLDRETSGVLLLAKNPQVANIMTEQFEQSNVKKCYFFISKITEQFKNIDEFTANEKLGNPGTGRDRVIVNAYDPDSFDGKTALTYFKIIHKENGYALGLAFPQTGRQHQIRVHAMTHGLPLIGDKLYLGGYALFQRFKDNLATLDDHELVELPRHALHSMGLKIPYQNQISRFIGTLPEDIKGWIKKKLSLNIEDLEKEVREKILQYFET